MQTDPGAWFRFWKGRVAHFDSVMEISTLAAARRLDQYFGFRKSHDVLDFGCGPGFLVKYFLQKDVKVTGIDINQDVIVKNRLHFPQAQFIHMDEGITSLREAMNEALGKKRFDFIILLSVVQYFDTADSVNKVVHLLQHLLKPSGRIIIADVYNSQTSRVRDGFAALLECIRHARGFAFLRFVLSILGREYRTIARRQPLLIVDEVMIEKIANANGLQWKKLPRMTVHPSRASYELRAENAVHV
jgi:2-polyprenyl-3-methyl-5-hydroxy-6-metoxy-1,4-benzoquinol methylase